MSYFYGRLDKSFIATLSLVVLVPWVAWLLEADIRLLSAIVGFVAFAALSFRLVSTLDDTDALHRALAVILLAMLFLAALGQLDLRSKDAPLTSAAYPILGLRVGCIIVAWYWPRMIGWLGSPLMSHPKEKS